MLQHWLHTFLNDTKVQALVLLVIADFVLGASAALKLGVFRFSYVADFLRNDIAFKLLPYFAFYVFALVAGSVDLVIPGLDFGAVAGAVYGLLVVAWVGSILKSAAELFPGIGPDSPSGRQTVNTALFGAERK